MIKCFQCRGPVPEPGGILLGLDGDFVCSQACKDLYEQERDHFFEMVVHSPEATERWLNDGKTLAEKYNYDPETGEPNV